MIRILTKVNLRKFYAIKGTGLNLGLNLISSLKTITNIKTMTSINTLETTNTNIQINTPNKNIYQEIKISKSEHTNLRLDRFLMNNYNLHWDTLQKSFRSNDIFIIRENENKRE